jgi:putative flavoprotein involved in K+ transport
MQTTHFTASHRQQSAPTTPTVPTAPTSPATTPVGDSAATSPATSPATPTATPSGSAPLDVLVVGAGQAGLSLAWHLQQHGARFLLVDAGPEVGHSWRNRWDSLRLFTPSRYDGLPGMPFPADPDCYPTKDEVADYLASYATRHALPVLTSTRVTALTPYDGGFVARTTQGMLRARQVVVATGPFQIPFVPQAAAGLDDSVVHLHSSAYRNPSSVTPVAPADRPAAAAARRVLVVGAGNSGLQIADELRAAGHEVHVAVGTQPPALPQRIAGRDLFWWLTRLGLIDKPADSRLARRLRARGDLVIGSSRREMQRRGVRFRPRLVEASGTVVRFADGSSETVDAVVWATGYRSDYTWIDAPVVDDDGRVQHQGGRSTTVPGLCFLGLPWQRSRGSSLLGFVQRDAAFLATHLMPARAQRPAPLDAGDRATADAEQRVPVDAEQPAASH